LSGALRADTKDLKITTGAYEYDSVDELVKHVGSVQLRKLKIQATDPHLSIEFYDSFIWVYVSKNQAKGAGLFHLIHEVLQRRLRTFSWIYSNSMVGGLIYGAVLIPLGQLGQGFFVGGVAVGILLIVWTGWIALKRHSLIRLYKKPANIFIRNRDQLFVAIVSALVGVVLGLLGNQLYKWLYP
jgi:hypothetical protein